MITGSGYNFRRAAESGAIAVEDHSNLTIAMALKAGAMGVPCPPASTPTRTRSHACATCVAERRSPVDDAKTRRIDPLGLALRASTRSTQAIARAEYEVAHQAARGLDLEPLAAVRCGAPQMLEVFVDLPVQEALAPLYASAIRTTVLLLVGLVMSVIAGLWLVRRMVQPIQKLQAGAALIGAGDLDQRIDLRTGYELQALGDEFNKMTERLRVINVIGGMSAWTNARLQVEA